MVDAEPTAPAGRPRGLGDAARTVVAYGLCGGAMVFALKMVEYRFLVVEHSLELYGGVVAVLFVALGVWAGGKLVRPRERVTERITERVVVREVPVVVAPASAPATDSAGARAAAVARFGLTPRELEILALIAEGLTTREIAGRLFVSENTVKTHSTNVFAKLAVNRRTQAVRVAREAGIVP